VDLLVPLGDGSVHRTLSKNVLFEKYTKHVHSPFHQMFYLSRIFHLPNSLCLAHKGLPTTLRDNPKLDQSLIGLWNRSHGTWLRCSFWVLLIVGFILIIVIINRWNFMLEAKVWQSPKLNSFCFYPFITWCAVSPLDFVKADQVLLKVQGFKKDDCTNILTKTLECISLHLVGNCNAKPKFPIPCGMKRINHFHPCNKSLITLTT